MSVNGNIDVLMGPKPGFICSNSPYYLDTDVQNVVKTITGIFTEKLSSYPLAFHPLMDEKQPYLVWIFNSSSQLKIGDVWSITQGASEGALGALLGANLLFGYSIKENGFRIHLESFENDSLSFSGKPEVAEVCKKMPEEKTLDNNDLKGPQTNVDSLKQSNEPSKQDESSGDPSGNFQTNGWSIGAGLTGLGVLGGGTVLYVRERARAKELQNQTTSTPSRKLTSH